MRPISDLTNDLRFRIDLYKPDGFVNELGEDDIQYVKDRTIWAGITVSSGTNRTMPDGSVYAEVTHKITIRDNAVEKLTNDMYFMFKGQRYDVKYSLPNYKYNDRIEVYCELEVE